jgi:AbrB family looped-hinge helix DNA binding protein
MNTTTINKDFRITIPKEIRESLGIHPGQKMTVKTSGGLISVIPEKTTKESK